MKTTWKKIAALVLAAVTSLSFVGCDKLLNDLEDAISSGIEDVLNSSTPDSTPNSTPDSTPDSSTPDSTPDDSTPDDSTGGDVITSDNLSIHFLELGNKNPGDCTYIKAGDVDILIDAGSKRGSAPTITNYISQYCTDGILEYVIATHAHEDHIAAFVGESGKKQGVFNLYRVGTLIDFPLTNSSSGIYNDYKALRSSIISEYGTKHYTALEWWNGVDGLTRSIEIANGITMNILYQKYYENKSSSENNYSVCVMFSENDNHYLFTGDLEKAGEESLVDSNTLPKVTLYKGGHHGSETSSSPNFLAKICPKIVCVCCCAGGQYNFPTQTFINNVALYTSQIYVTTMVDSNSTGFTSMNGNIVVSSVGGVVTVNCSNNNTILKETAWFKANRVWPTNGV